MKHITKITLAIVFTASQIQTLSAQTPGFDDDVIDAPATPVDQGLVPMIIIGIILIYFFKTKTSKS